MSLDAATANELIAKLAADREAYLGTLDRAHELVAQALAAAGGTNQPRLTTRNIRRATGSTGTNVNVLPADVESVQKGSVFSAEDEPDTEDDESLFVQQSLPPESYDEEGLRRHIQEFDWPAPTRAVLKDILEDENFIKKKCLFPTEPGPVEDRSHLTHYSIFDVGNDGAPLEKQLPVDSTRTSRALTIWNLINNINMDPSKRQAVGRITIVREPSPILFAAVHYCLHKHVDIDELYRLLVDDAPVLYYPPRAFADDMRHRRGFSISFEFFTIIGEGCKPMAWQHSEEHLSDTKSHIPITRCSSTVALSLEGPPISKVRNKGRAAKRITGDVFDPFAPWRVVSVQAYPDWKSSIDSHDSTKHYVNGPEAFMITLRAEYKDAQKRLMEIYTQISHLVRPPTDFMFNRDTRDKLLFEDDEFTYSRRYFWAYQALGIMNEDIQEMVSAYKDTFTDNVWAGHNKTIWPGDESVSSRYAHWRKRMASIRKDMDYDIHRLEEIESLNLEKMREIKGLRDNLFSGTSVLESRRSVQQATITVQQGRNIKLLTLVTIFFLPLTFVTSVFGMTNMDQSANFNSFAIVTLTICVPTYMLIGSLNTTTGLDFWMRETDRFYSYLGRLAAKSLALVGYTPKWAIAMNENSRPEPGDSRPEPEPTNLGVIRPMKGRSQSASEGMAARMNLERPPVMSPRESHLKLDSSASTSEALAISGNEPRIHFHSSTSATGPDLPTKNGQHGTMTTHRKGLTDSGLPIRSDGSNFTAREEPTQQGLFSGLWNWGSKSKKGTGREMEQV